MKDEVIVDYSILVDSSGRVLGGEANQAKLMRADFKDIVDGYIHSRQVVAIAQTAPESKMLKFAPFLSLQIETANIYLLILSSLTPHY